jgi:HEAT repeat protein
MSPLAVFFRTLSRSSAICLGVGLAIVNPPLDWSPTRAMSGGMTRAQLRGVTAQKSPNEAAIDGLIAALTDTDAGVRTHAALALGELRSPRAVQPLIAAVKDSNVDVRKHALMALAEIGDESAIAAVTAALKDEDPGVRRAAAMALAEMSGGNRYDRPHPHPRPNPSPNPNPNPNPNPRPGFGGGR